MQLVYAFVYAYAKIRFSHDVALLVLDTSLNSASFEKYVVFLFVCLLYWNDNLNNVLISMISTSNFINSLDVPAYTTCMPIVYPNLFRRPLSFPMF